MYKNIIPGLVSFETNIDELHGFIMCQNFNYFDSIPDKNRFHYKIEKNEELEIPNNYDLRSEYFFKKDDTWYYDRKLLIWQPQFKYSEKEKTLSFNKDQQKLPFRLGGMFTMGEHFCNLIDLHLFLEGFIVMRGVAVRYQNKNIGICGPGFNGKTTMLKKMLKKGAQYIAEDYLIIDLNTNSVFPTCPLVKENFWRQRKIDSELKELLLKNNSIKTLVSLDELHLIQNTTTDKIALNKQFIDFVLLNSLYFLNNFFTRSYIFEKNLTTQIFDRVQELQNINLSYKFTNIKNFNYNIF